MKPFDSQSILIPSKNSFEFSNPPPKKAPPVEISMLNRDKMVSMAPNFDPNRCQWLHILIQIGVNGSGIWSKLASMAQDYSPIGHCGAIDANMDQILEPLTRIWIKMWSHWRQLGSHSGAIDADMDPNLEPLTPSRFGLARKFKPGGLFKWGKKTQMNFLMILLYWGGPRCRHSFINQIEETSLRALWIWQHKYCQCPRACPAYFVIVLASLYWDILASCLKMTANHAVILKKAREDVPIQGFTALWVESFHI